MKRRYAEGGVFEEGDEVPGNTADMMSASGPMTKKQRLGNLNIDPNAKLTAEERKRFSRLPDTMLPPPAKGKEVGVRKKASKSEVYEKTFAKGGSASSRADGCCSRGKTRGKMV